VTKFEVEEIIALLLESRVTRFPVKLKNKKSLMALTTSKRNVYPNQLLELTVDKW
jgi:hypothetical protein